MRVTVSRSSSSDPGSRRAARSQPMTRRAPESRVQAADFLLDLAASKGRGGGDPTDPWTHLQNRIGLFAQDDVRLTDKLTLNLGLRWAYTSPLVEKDNRQTNFDLVTGRQIFAEDGELPAQRLN